MRWVIWAQSHIVFCRSLFLKPCTSEEHCPPPMFIRTFWMTSNVYLSSFWIVYVESKRKTHQQGNGTWDVLQIRQDHCFHKDHWRVNDVFTITTPTFIPSVNMSSSSVAYTRFQRKQKYLTIFNCSISNVYMLASIRTETGLPFQTC